MTEENNNQWPKQDILTASETMKSEYCCNVIRIGEILPIEGADRLGQTYINGESVVVRKDQVKEGDVLMFAMNECQLCKEFLGANNLYRDYNAEANSNWETIKPLKEQVETLKAEIKLNLSVMKQLNRAKRLLQNKQDLNAVDKAKSILFNYFNDTEAVDKFIASENIDIAFHDIIEDVKKKGDEMDKEATAIGKQIASQCGFFDDNGRVRAIRLKGTPSFGYILSQAELAKMCPDVMKLNLEDYIGMDFDTVGGILLAKPYVPKQPARKGSGRGKRYNKMIDRANKLDMIIPGEFNFHYETDPLGKNIWKISPTDNVSITVKIHGTAMTFANVIAKIPNKLTFWEKLKNFFITTTGLLTDFKVPEWHPGYHEIYSSRRVIRNEEINQGNIPDFYSSDNYGHWAQLLSGKIPEDMTIYGEIFGYDYKNPDGKMIQKSYDYGATDGENFFMPYRISVHNRETGDNDEWDIEKVYEWTIEFIKKYPELSKLVKPIDILYHGPFNELYPDIPVDRHWHDSILRRMADDKELFGMEEPEPMCVNKVPREGLVIRVDGAKVPAAYKLKTLAFRDWEKKQIDNGEVDEEMAEGYSTEEITNGTGE